MRKILIKIFILLMIILIIAQSGIAATNKLPAPESLEIIPPETTIIAKGSRIALQVTPYPEGHSNSVKWNSSNTSVAAVNAKGIVSAKSEGKVTIIATSALNPKIKATIDLVVFDPKKPVSMEFNADNPLKLDVLQTFKLSAAVLPAEASQKVQWSSDRPGVASISPGGIITAKKKGAALITATHSVYKNFKKSIKVEIAASPAPVSIQVSAATNELIVGGTLALETVTTPENASKVFSYASGNVKVATVDRMGVVKAIGVGTTQITVTSQRSRSVKSTFRVYVYDDPDVPCMLSLNHTALFLGEGDTITLKPAVVPSSAQTGFEWSSGNTSVATVSGDGTVRAVGPGQTKITCTADAGGLSATATVTVLQTTLSSVMPDMTTDINGIPGNLAKIEAIRRSAINEILRLQALSEISAEESNDRQAIINRAFGMYAFPWMTEKLERYFDPHVRGKDYRPGPVYYGLQYIQHGNNNAAANRQYDVNKAVSEGYFVSTGKGYYLRDTDKKLNGKYVGTDCSGFVGICQFGMNGGSRTFSSSEIMAHASYFKTVGDWADLRPGDILVKSGKHSAMFLYHINIDTPQKHMVIIHQGGLSNTVECIINISYFKSTGYIARRQIGYD